MRTMVRNVAVMSHGCAADQKGDMPGADPEAYWVGAHLDFAVVEADDVKIERIHEWPDEIFKAIAR